MSITYHNTQIMTLALNQTDVQTGTYHSILVFQKNGVVDIYSSFTISAFSVAPPPYDDNGNNYDTPAPLSTEEKTINLGDVTNYDYIVFKWNNEGSFVPYGMCKATATIGEQEITLFNGSGNSRQKTKIDVKDLSGVYSIKFKVYAKSNSSYRGYGCSSVLNIEYVQGMVGSGETPTGVTFPDFQVGKVDSFAPPPYVSPTEQYNINGYEGAPVYATHILELGDVTNYNTLSFTWDTWDPDDPDDPTTKAGSGYNSRIVAYYEDPTSHQRVYLFDETTHSMNNRMTDTATVDLSQLSGTAQFKITVGAISGNDYAPYGAHCIIFCTDILMS